MDDVAIVDLGGAGDASRRADPRVAERLASGLAETGFVRVRGHGIEPAAIRRAKDAFARFFALPEEAKRRTGGAPGGQRGFTPFGVEHAKDHAAPDLKEFFHVGREPSADHPNRWPRELPELRPAAVSLFEALERCAVRLLTCLEQHFALDAGELTDMVRGGNHVLRALHYPPVPAGADPSSLRAAPHEDINLITLLPEPSGAGLEIRTPEGRWVAVAAAPDEIVADAGDMLARLTNGTLPATTHRVVNPAPGAPGPSSRHSLPFFAHPRSEADLSVLPRFVSSERPPRYPPITAGEYLRERLAEIGLLTPRERPGA